MKMRARVGKMPKPGGKHQDLIDLLLDGNGLYDMRKKDADTLRQRLYRLNKSPIVLKQDDGLYTVGIKT